jgi:Kef-type K+ transport system membrane component KefB
MKRIPQTKRIKSLKRFVRMSDELHRDEKKFRLIEISSILLSLLAAVFPLTLEVISTTESLIALADRPNFWTFLILIILLITCISLLPLFVKKYLRKANKRTVVLKKQIVATYLKALETTSIKPDLSSNGTANE